MSCQPVAVDPIESLSQTLMSASGVRVSGTRASQRRAGRASLRFKRLVSRSAVRLESRATETKTSADADAEAERVRYDSLGRP